MDGTFMTVFELIETKTGKKKKYQYDWEYQRGKLWKWHNEPHSHKQHQTNYHIKWIHRLRTNI
ncbi:toxin-antitoxin system TumE family protein [Paenibacillus sp. OSY-SE]|uniref:toxin-antitoxin system TumE family protein n=1 Tax=Paenibacillus sp. OSY-SE TaxID=1196323 RepID=UPI003FCEDB97